MANNQVNVSGTGVLKIIVDLVSQDQANNTSKIRVRGQMINNSSVAAVHSAADIGRSIGGTVDLDASHFSFNIGAGVTLTYLDSTFTVQHAANGTLSVNFSVSYGKTSTTVFGDNKTVNVTAAITRIPKRPSSPHTPNYSNVTGDSFTITWGASDDNGGAPITSYKVRTSLSQSFPAGYTDNDANNTSRTFTGLAPGTVYWHRIFAFNGVADGGGYSDYSQNHTGTLGTPGAPAGGSVDGPGTPVISNQTSDSLTLTWTAPTSDGGATIDYYVLTQWNNVGGTGTPTILQVYDTTTDLTGLTPGQGYRWSVAGHNSAGTGPSSTPITVTLTSSPTAPSAPTFSNVLPTSLTIKWTAPSSTGGVALTGYKVRMFEGSDTSGSSTDVDLTGTATTTSITGLNPGQLYTFQIFAVNSSTDNDGLSDPSPTSTIQMLAGAWIRVAGDWKLAVPYVRTDGVWKLAVPYVRESGTWHLTS